MFSLFVESLQKGREPDMVDLRKRLDISLIKKMGVLNLPYHFWQSDQKINPSSAHMLWAAVYLEDQEGIAVVAELKRREAEEAQKYKKAGQGKFDADGYRTLLTTDLDDLLILASETDLKVSVQDKCKKAKRFLSLE